LGKVAHMMADSYTGKKLDIG